MIGDHEDFGTDQGVAPRIVPVVHDNFEADEQLLIEAFRRASGHLYVIDSAQKSWEGKPTAGLQAVVRAAADGAGIPLEVDIEGGVVDVSSSVEFEGNESNSILLAAVARLLSSELGALRLVGLAYEAGGLDSARKALLWQLLVEHAPPHLPDTISTFVPIEIGPVDYVRHCGGSPSARFAVVGDDARKRTLEEAFMASKIERVVPSLDQPLVLFLGAGASASARIPVGDSVRDAAIRRLVGSSSAEVAESFRVWVLENHRLLSDESGLSAEQFAERLTLERVLREEFKDLAERGKTREQSETVQELREACDAALDREPPGRVALRELLDKHPRTVVVTVNFDRQIEAGLESQHRVYASPDDFASAADHVRRRCRGEAPEIPILKIHGSIEQSQTLVADLDETEAGLPHAVKDALESLFEDEYKPLNWLWIGCSMRDRDITQWMRGKTESDIFDLWIDALPGRTIFRFIRDCREEILSSVQKHIVSELPDVFLPALAARIQGMATAKKP